MFEVLAPRRSSHPSGQCDSYLSTAPKRPAKWGRAMRLLHFVFALSTSSQRIGYASEIVAFPHGASLCAVKCQTFAKKPNPAFFKHHYFLLNLSALSHHQHACLRCLTIHTLIAFLQSLQMTATSAAYLEPLRLQLPNPLQLNSENQMLTTINFHYSHQPLRARFHRLPPQQRPHPQQRLPCIPALDHLWQTTPSREITPKSKNIAAQRSLTLIWKGSARATSSSPSG